MYITEFPDLSEAERASLVRAISFQHEGQFFEAGLIFEQLIRRSNPHPIVSHTVGLFSLLMADYERGWHLLEERLKLPQYQLPRLAGPDVPVWDGSDHKNKTLLLYADQGLGDTILVGRYLPWVRDCVGHVVICVNPGTVKFWKRLYPWAEVVEDLADAPQCDLKLTLFSLMNRFGADPSNTPPPGYLTACPKARNYWRGKLARQGFNVGLSWQGNPSNVRDWERSIPFDMFGPLFELEHINFYSLQVMFGQEQLKASSFRARVTDFADEILAFDDPLEATAALISECDLVIFIESGLANLAAAMDVPFWMPVYKVPDWRWRFYPTRDYAEPARAPWYRSARLFVGPVRGEWEGVVNEMRDELETM